MDNCIYCNNKIDGTLINCNVCNSEINETVIIKERQNPKVYLRDFEVYFEDTPESIQNNITNYFGDYDNKRGLVMKKEANNCYLKLHELLNPDDYYSIFLKLNNLRLKRLRKARKYLSAFMKASKNKKRNICYNLNLLSIDYESDMRDYSKKIIKKVLY